MDPDNRLVAAELEQQWEKKLCELREAQEASERLALEQTAATITPELRQQLSDLNQKLPQLWFSDQLTHEQRKHLLRSLILRVILKRIAPDQVHIKIVWISGHFSEKVVCPPIWRQVDVSNYSAILERIKQLWQKSLTDDQIAQILNDEGFHSARKKQFTGLIVLKIRHQQGWKSALYQHRGAEKIDGMWTIQGLSKKLGVPVHWFYNRIRDGFLHEPDLIRQPQGNYLILDDEQLMLKLQEAVQQTRKSPSKLHS